MYYFTSGVIINIINLLLTLHVPYTVRIVLLLI